MSDATGSLFGDVESNLTRPTKRKKPASIGMPRTVRILLEENDNIPPTGLFLGVNGTGFILRAGIEVDVPPAVLDVLQHAVISLPVMDPSTQQVVGHRDQRRYPFRVISHGRSSDDSG